MYQFIFNDGTCNIKSITLIFVNSVLFIYGAILSKFSYVELAIFFTNSM